MSPAMMLAHEMGHAVQHLDGEIEAGKEYSKRQRLAIEEANLAKYETPIAKQLGEPTCRSYNSHRGIIRMNNSTHYRTLHRGYHGWGYYTVDHNNLFFSGISTITADPDN
ncbi:hypothetical protein RBH29_03660 [Herbivorax sp. ANBcel31]|uniref:hypothetical protein n=1 Tax=Herbivorax sp. ANBcel31 TaxID=3069754 RepID=UPI0027B7FCE8|nr:hypothetical protein [Herbivorax sp. ANBcel31]MDQ2085529.1 hypothetical protein [Herbivorax sp. ANBcel31]